MTPLLFPIYTSRTLFQNLKLHTSCEEGQLFFHTFPDDEINVVITSDIRDRDIVFVATLDHPNVKILPLIFAAETARSLGAKRIGLVSPYLAYMREDKQFVPGGSITSHYFSALISNYFDWMVTVDPHLHRITHLNEVYRIPTRSLHATDPIADWIQKNIVKPLIIGPDQESEQWIKAIAEKINAPHILLTKIRKGDRDIEITLPSLDSYSKHTPILIDDIISSGRTMIAPLQQLTKLSMPAPICIGVHAIFADNAYQDLLNAGASQVISCNTIEHPSNTIDLSSLMAVSIHELLENLIELKE